MTPAFSRRLAIVYGVLLPIVETIRRWPQLGDITRWPSWLDDFILAAFLLYGAWRTSADTQNGQRYLVAAWGLTCGMGYGSFFGQLLHMDQPDPAPIPPVWVVVIKGVGMILAIAALIGSLRPRTVAMTPRAT